jgi:hypothetical protein
MMRPALARVGLAKQVSLLAEGGPLEAQADPQRLHLALTNSSRTPSSSRRQEAVFA